MSELEHRAGQIVASLAAAYKAAGVAGGNVSRRRVYGLVSAFNPLSSLLSQMPAVDVHFGEDTPLGDPPYKGNLVEYELQVHSDLYVYDPDSDLSPVSDLDARSSRLRLAVERVLFAAPRNYGLPYIVETYPGGAFALAVEREAEAPIMITRVSARVHYQALPGNPVEVQP